MENKEFVCDICDKEIGKDEIPVAYSDNDKVKHAHAVCLNKLRDAQFADQHFLC